jgi:hypothetical protein
MGFTKWQLCTNLSQVNKLTKDQELSGSSQDVCHFVKPVPVSGNVYTTRNLIGEMTFMEQDFIIDKASWHTKKIRNYAFDNSIIYDYFKNIFLYLERNGLATKKLTEDNLIITDETCLRKSHLTEEGLALVKAAYDKWTDRVVDKKIEPTNFQLLDKALIKVRKQLNSTTS